MSSGALFFGLTFLQMYAGARELPILRPLCAREAPHAGAVFVGLGQQLDAMALERLDELGPHLAADMSVYMPKSDGRHLNVK
jgi:hypothetical protein